MEGGKSISLHGLYTLSLIGHVPIFSFTSIIITIIVVVILVESCKAHYNMIILMNISAVSEPIFNQTKIILSF